MKKTLTLLATMLTAALTFAQTTATVTGNLLDPSETATSSGISVDVTLVNTNTQRCFVSGVGTLIKEKATYTAAQVLAGITLAKTPNITCGATTGQTRWRFSFKNGTTSRDCDLQITGATSLNTATCLQATSTPPTTLPTSSLYLLLDGSNSMTGNLIPAVNGTQSIGNSGSRWDMFADAIDVGTTLNVAGTSTLANVTMGTGNTLNVNNIKQQAGAGFNMFDPNGGDHFFISTSAPYTNTFLAGNGSGVIFLGSAAKTSVADTTGNIVTAGNITLQTTSGTLPAVISNDTAGGVAFSNNAGKALQFDNFTNVLFPGSTSGNTIVKAPAVASGTLTLPAATDTLVGQNTTDTLTNKTLTAVAITGGATNRNLKFNGSAQVVNGNTTDDLTTFSTNADKLQIQVGVSQGSGHKHQRFGSLCSTAASAGTSCTTAVTWTSAFADANYTVTCTGVTQTNFPVLSVESIAAAGFTIRIGTNLASAATFATVDCMADHD